MVDHSSFKRTKSQDTDQPAEQPRKKALDQNKIDLSGPRLIIISNKLYRKGSQKTTMNRIIDLADLNAIPNNFIGNS